MMRINWNDSRKFDGMLMMMDDVRTWDQERRDQVSQLAVSLNGLTLEEVEAKINALQSEGYQGYRFTVTDQRYSFRVDKQDVRGWDGISFTLSENGIVREATVF